MYRRSMESTPLADILRSARERKGQSLRSAAKDLGVPASYLSRVETGQKPASAGLRERAGGLYDLDGDALCIAAGDIPADVSDIIKRHPELLAELRTRYEDGQ